MDSVSCTEHACTEESTVEVLWPGQGWLPYCTAHGARADMILTMLGSRTEIRVLRAVAKHDAEDP